MTDPLTRFHDQNFSDALRTIRNMMGTLALSRDLQEFIPGFKTQKGIYKPQNSEHALWIRQTLRGIYPDQKPDWLPDGSWLYKYTPEAKDGRTDLTLNTNRALLKSMKDGAPVGVFRQREDMNSQTTYEVLGLAFIEDFDGTYFVLHGEPIDVEAEPMNRLAIPSFQPFDPSPSSVTSIIRNMRRKAFQTGIRRLYHEKCSLCELGYHFKGEPIGIEAAHLIPVSDKGTSKDLRNGILLCSNHHNLFDRLLWTFDEDYRVLVREDRLFRKSAENNHVLKMEGLRLPNLPDKEYDLPASEAIDFRLKLFENAR